MLRVVLDTNILVSAIIHDGKPRKLFRLGLDGRYQILTSKEILDELSEVLQRPRFRMTREDIISIVSALIESVENVRITSNFQAVSRDPDDNVIINTAHDGKAEFIVSGDKYVKDLKKFQGIKIVSVSEMLKILEQ